MGLEPRLRPIQFGEPSVVALVVDTFTRGCQMNERQLADGSPVPADNSHREIQPNGQQRDYVVLSPEERAKGFVKPVRDSYVHAFPSETDRKIGCGVETRMGASIAETFARDPRLYTGTFCVGCGTHFPLKEFIWDGGGELHGEPMDPDLQEAWLVETRARRAREKEERRLARISALKAELAELEAQNAA